MATFFQSSVMAAANAPTHKVVAVDGQTARIAPINSRNTLADSQAISYDRFTNTPTLHCEVRAIHTKNGMRFITPAPVLDAETLAMPARLAKGMIDALMALGFSPDHAQSALRAALG